MDVRRRLLLAAAAAAAVAPRFAHTQPMQLLQRAIPKSGEKLPVLGLGTSGSFDVDAGGNDGAAAREALAAFAEGGATVVDSSPMYGRAERAVGELAESLGLLPQLFIATKIWTEGKD